MRPETELQTAIRSIWAHQLAELAKSSNSRVRGAVARNSFSSTDTLSILSRDISPSIRVQVARSLQTSTTDLVELSKDRDADVRCWAFQNRNMPSSALVMSPTERSLYVAFAIARHPSTSVYSLVSLYHIEHPDLQWTISENPNLTPLAKIWMSSGYSDQMTFAEFEENCQ